MTTDIFHIPRIPVDPACIAIPCEGRNGPVDDHGSYTYVYELEARMAGIYVDVGLLMPHLNSME